MQITFLMRKFNRQPCPVFDVIQPHRPTSSSSILVLYLPFYTVPGNNSLKMLLCFVSRYTERASFFLSFEMFPASTLRLHSESSFRCRRSVMGRTWFLNISILVAVIMLLVNFPYYCNLATAFAVNSLLWFIHKGFFFFHYTRQ